MRHIRDTVAISFAANVWGIRPSQVPRDIHHELSNDRDERYRLRQEHTVHRDLLPQGEMDVAGARRHVDNQVV